MNSSSSDLFTSDESLFRVASRPKLSINPSKGYLRSAVVSPEKLGSERSKSREFRSPSPEYNNMKLSAVSQLLLNLK